MTLLSTLGRHVGFSFDTGAIAKAVAVLRQRRALARLDDAALKDLGLTAGDVNAEIRRPVWDVPSNWRG
ncbi:DUF1127 domain-containing protein [Thiosulfatihalobacter marinus]|jgi:hypothetical protein|uniref:DUF1127 domain-containing protein n=1 Tax=Thiosulfatihalobacter marinus TaxID=2792481 RepID=UPI0018D8B9C9|nr:DUF1127 domain-containing protein [Thiosulfatihalobacter marinus]